MSLGQFISKKRKSMMLTQEELADRIHVSKSAVAKWETDGGIPDRDNLYKLAEIMKISVNELHQMITNSRNENDMPDVNITAEIIALLESYGYKVTRKDE